MKSDTKAMPPPRQSRYFLYSSDSSVHTTVTLGAKFIFSRRNTGKSIKQPKSRHHTEVTRVKPSTKQGLQVHKSCPTGYAEIRYKRFVRFIYLGVNLAVTALNKHTTSVNSKPKYRAEGLLSVSCLFSRQWPSSCFSRQRNQ